MFSARQVHFWRSFGPHLTAGTAALLFLLLFGDFLGSDTAENAAAFSLWVATYVVYYLLLRYRGRLPKLAKDEELRTPIAERRRPRPRR